MIDRRIIRKVLAAYPLLTDQHREDGIVAHQRHG
jgi:hypothetical protein